MTGKILRRCTICKNFHASYLVVDPKLGNCYLCYSCWKARQSQEAAAQAPGGKKEDVENDLEKSKTALAFVSQG